MAWRMKIMKMKIINSESVMKYHEIMYQASENGENGMAWYRKMIIGVSAACRKRGISEIMAKWRKNYGRHQKHQRNGNNISEIRKASK
jgi:hypothetical protein